MCPVALETAPPALEELATGLLAQLDFEYPAGGRFATRDWSPYPGGEGLEIETERRAVRAESDSVAADK